LRFNWPLLFLSGARSPAEDAIAIEPLPVT
jgi:hypothetical protein